jgi:hypothetical protein
MRKSKKFTAVTVVLSGLFFLSGCGIPEADPVGTETAALTSADNEAESSARVELDDAASLSCGLPGGCCLVRCTRAPYRGWNVVACRPYVTSAADCGPRGKAWCAARGAGAPTQACWGNR